MGKWSDWVDLDGAIISAPSAASRVKEHMMVVARGTENEIVYRLYEDGVGWGNWGSLGGRSTYDPATLSGHPENYTVYHVGGGQAIWRRTYTEGSGWDKDWSRLHEGTEAWAGLGSSLVRGGPLRHVHPEQLQPAVTCHRHARKERLGAVQRDRQHDPGRRRGGFMEHEPRRPRRPRRTDQHPVAPRLPWQHLVQVA